LGIAKTNLEAARKQLAINRRLEAFDNISSLDISLSEAQVSVARSELVRSEAIVSECTVEAPFSGEIVVKYVEAYQHVNEGEPLFELVDNKNLEIEMIVPSILLTEFVVGRRFSITLDETGLSLGAKINRIVGFIDPVSQTLNVIGQPLQHHSELMAGMSGGITFEITD